MSAFFSAFPPLFPASWSPVLGVSYLGREVALLQLPSLFGLLLTGFASQVVADTPLLVVVPFLVNFESALPSRGHF